MSSFGDMHHVGITVRDLEASLSWYEQDLRPEAGVHRRGIRTGPVDGGRSAGRQACASPSSASAAAWSSCSATTTTGRRRFDRSNADVGSAHVCIDVPDLQAAYEDLQAKGVEFLAPPLHIDDGPLEGCAFVYFKDPNGVTLELFQS